MTRIAAESMEAVLRGLSEGAVCVSLLTGAGRTGGVKCIFNFIVSSSLCAAQAARALARPIVYLIGLNVVFFWAMNGGLAWGAHLGGFLSGWGLGLLYDRRRA